MGECFFWYRPTRVVPDQRPLNGRRRRRSIDVKKYFLGVFIVENIRTNVTRNIFYDILLRLLCYLKYLSSATHQHYNAGSKLLMMSVVCRCKIT